MITTLQTRTIGGGGDFATLASAFDWLHSEHIQGAGYADLVLLPGTHQAASPQLNHPAAARIGIRGSGLAVPPLAAAMTGNVATDEAMTRASFPTVLELGTAGGNKFGLSLPYGLGSLQNIGIVAQAAAPPRYMVSVGPFSNSWQTAAGPGGALAVGNVGLFGGVWHMICVNSYITNTGRIFSGHCQPDGASQAGGFALLANCKFESASLPATDFQAYLPGSRYGILSRGSVAILDGSADIRRPDVALNVFGGAVSAKNAVINGGGAAAFAQDGATVNLSGALVENCHLDAYYGQEAQLWDGNTVRGWAVSIAGAASTITHYNAIYRGCTAPRMAYTAGGGQFIGTCRSEDSLWSEKIVEVVHQSDWNGDLLVTAPRAGSIDVMTAHNGGRIGRLGSAGVTTSPALSSDPALAY